MQTVTSVFFSQETKLPPIWLLFSSTGEPVEYQELLQKVLVHLREDFYLLLEASSLLLILSHSSPSVSQY